MFWASRPPGQPVAFFGFFFFFGGGGAKQAAGRCEYLKFFSYHVPVRPGMSGPKDSVRLFGEPGRVNSLR